MTIKDGSKRRLALVWSAIVVGAACGCGSRSSFVALGKRAMDAGPAADGVDAQVGRTASTVPTSNPSVSREPEPAPRDMVEIDQTARDNPAGLAAADVEKLKAGGPVGTLRWLYPYDGTVFPRDLIAPTLMWEGDPAVSAIYLRVRSKYFEYQTIAKPVGANIALVLPLEQHIWELAGTQSQGKDDPFMLELSTYAGGVVAGPIVQRFWIAPASVKGSIYYTTSSATTSGWGSLFRLPPGRGAELVVRGDANGPVGRCSGCHAVSADGSRLVVQTMDVTAAPGTSSFAQAYSYALGADGEVGSAAPLNRYAAFAALYPDGSMYITGSNVQNGVAAAGPLGGSYGNIRALDMSIPTAATLYDTEAGQVIADTGIAHGALMPMFSPDGNHVVFNDFALERAHGLAMMDFDRRSRTAQNYRVLMQEDASGATLGKPGMRPAWPFFLPDSKAVVFARTDSPSFTGGAAAAGVNLTAMSGRDVSRALSSSNLHIVEVATGRMTLLAKAMGFDSQDDAEAGRTYLPFGTADLHHNYNPTVSPVAAGGYFWVFFDSVRNYGSLGLKHQLWGAALEIRTDGSYATDPSHPPFYVTGQQAGVSNFRAFAARDACLPEGPCTSGIDCCSGFCSETCVPPPRDRCSRTDEHCGVSADCCEGTDACINGFCALVPLL